MKVKTDIKSQVDKTLLDLGDSPEAVEDKLRSWAIEGKKRDEEECPIANHIRIQLALSGLNVKIRVNSLTALFWLGEDFIGFSDLPESVQSFITKFDKE